jgi:hypothetical protein
MEQGRPEVEGFRSGDSLSGKIHYGVKSLETLILKLDGELIPLKDRQMRGENVDLAIRNKEERKAEYERALADLERFIVREQNLVMSMPRFRGIVRVKPGTKPVTDAAADPEVEKAGMDAAMSYERKEGREPEDVSSENLGFDIRSREKTGGCRSIEVTARSDVGAVALTQNEWFKAKRFGDDYYLYAVMNAKKLPQLFPIRNPYPRSAPMKE